MSGLKHTTWAGDSLITNLNYHSQISDEINNELKSLLGRGDLVAPDGTPLGPKDFLGAPPAQGSFEGVLGRTDKASILDSSEKSLTLDYPKIAGDFETMSSKSSLEYRGRSIFCQPVFQIGVSVGRTRRSQLACASIFPVSGLRRV